MRLLASHGRLLLVLVLVLLLLAAVRLVEFQPLQGDAQGLVAIESALVYEPGQAQAYRVSLPVRSLRDRREVVQLRAVSEFELAELPQGPPWMLYVEDLHDGGRLKVNGVVVADLPATDGHTTVRQLRPSRFELPQGLLRVGSNVIEREWAIHENMLLMRKCNYLLQHVADFLRVVGTRYHRQVYIVERVQSKHTDAVTLLQLQRHMKYIINGCTALAVDVIHIL